MKRRTFLRQAAAAMAAAPIIIPASARGRDGHVAPSDRIVMAGIGVGGMGSGHVRSFTGHKDVQMLAVCDVRQEHRDRNKAYVDGVYGNSDCMTFNDYRELLDRDDIDAVFMACPDYWHVLVGLEAAKKGKHIYYEKPMSMSIEESKAMRAAVKRYGIVFQFGTQQRSDIRFRRTVELAWNGYFGNMKQIIIGSASYEQIPHQKAEPVPEGLDYDMWLGPAPAAPFTSQRCTRNWTLLSDYSLGCLSGAWGIHHIDISQLANKWDHDTPRFVEGTGYYPTDGFYDTAKNFHVEHVYDNDFRVVHMDMPTAQKYDKRFELDWMGILFEGDEGWIYVTRTNMFSEPKKLVSLKLKPTDERITPASNDHRRNFLDAVKGLNEPASPIDAAFHSDLTCHQAHIAMKLQKRLEWDSEKEEFKNDAQANRMLSRSMRSPWHL